MEKSRYPLRFPSGAAKEEHLLLLRIATAAGLLLDIRTLRFVSVYLWCQSLRRLSPTSPSLAGLAGGCGERGTCAAVSIIPLGSCSGGGLAGRTAAAAGSGWTCWLSQECSAPSLSRVLCCPLCLTSQGKTNQVWKEMALRPPLSDGPAGG